MAGLLNLPVAAPTTARGLPWRAACLTLALALVGHLLALGWLAAHWKVPEILQPMAAPLFTRQITRLEVPAGPVLKPKAVKASVTPSSVATNSVANKQLTPTLAPIPPLTEPAAASTQAAAVPLPTPAASVSSPEPPPQLAVQPAALQAAQAAQELARWPADTRLSYKLGGNFRGELHGDAQVQWQREAERYQVQVSISLGWLANVVMTSQGKVSAQGLQPAAYEEKLPSGRRTVELGDSQLVFNDGQRLARPPRVQDTASQFVDLTWRFLNAEVPLQQGSAVRFWMARPGGLDEWIYDVVALDTLSTRLGPVPAWHLVPRPLARPRGNITAEMWFAPSLQYLPVRIKMNLGPDAHVDLLIEKVEQR